MEDDKITLTIEVENISDLKKYVKIDDYYNLVFELRHNFFRNWKHSQRSDEFIEGVNDVIEKLYELLDEHEL